MACEHHLAVNLRRVPAQRPYNKIFKVPDFESVEQWEVRSL